MVMVSLRFSPAELERVKEVAVLNHQTVSAYCRDVLLDDAESRLERSSASVS